MHQTTILFHKFCQNVVFIRRYRRKITRWNLKSFSSKSKTLTSSTNDINDLSHQQIWYIVKTKLHVLWPPKSLPVTPIVCCFKAFASQPRFPLTWLWRDAGPSHHRPSGCIDWWQPKTWATTFAQTHGKLESWPVTTNSIGQRSSLAVVATHEWTLFG